jgi:hypothetical protein
VERAFAVVAWEMRAGGAQQVLAPVVDVARDPRWGRIEEIPSHANFPRSAGQLPLFYNRLNQFGERAVEDLHESRGHRSARVLPESARLFEGPGKRGDARVPAEG